MADSGDRARSLRTVTRTQGNNADLTSGMVRPANIDFEFEDVPVLVQGFRRMVRDLEFDVCEMALTTYLVAKAHGVQFTAVPAFLVRGFHHGAILYNPSSDMTNPKDLEGRKVGVNRGYTVTTGVWARGILADELGVDLDQVTWVLSGDEHVADYRPPRNVIPNESGHTLQELLASGELAAVVGADIDAADVAPLIPNPEVAGFAALQSRGHYPINHLVVVKDEVLRNRPEVGVAVFDAFARAKQRYVERLRSGAIEAPTATDRMYQKVLDLTGTDPLPYGIEPNRQVLEELMRHAVSQHILSEPMPIDELFAEDTRDLIA